MVRPPGIEPGLRVPETLVISFSLRARGVFVAETGERGNGGRVRGRTGEWENGRVGQREKGDRRRRGDRGFRIAGFRIFGIGTGAARSTANKRPAIRPSAVSRRSEKDHFGFGLTLDHVPAIHDEFRVVGNERKVKVRVIGEYHATIHRPETLPG